MSACIPVSPRSVVWLMLAGLSMAGLAGAAEAQAVTPPASAPATHAPPPPKPAPKAPTIPAPPGPPAKPGTAAHTKTPGHPVKTPPAAAHKKAASTPSPVTAPPVAPKPAEPETQKPPEPPKGGTGLPLPRFAALRSDDVNMRAGPGTRYPIDWVYKRRDLPVEIEREFEVWRLVRDPDGTKGWVHQATLTGRRTLIVTGATRSLRKTPDAQAPVVAELKPGVLGRIRSCEAGSDWCQVQIGDYRGFLKRSDFWGTQPGEVIAN
jgi:SH3-like domain-containing protein